MNKLVAEFLGTFFLMLTIGLAAGLGHAGDLAPVAIGAVLLAMIFAGGHISAAHYNPAVTLAFWVRGRCPLTDVPGYVVSQLLGAGLAAMAVLYLADGASMPITPRAVGPTALAEFLFTFALCWVILNVATAKGTEGNSFYGLAISALVVGGAYAVGPISGGVFNPAVAVGVAILGISEWPSIGLYATVQVAAALLAALAFKSVAGN